MELLLKTPTKILGRVEVTRSFSYKLNVGNYESRDFFCSQKAECKWKDAEAVSEALYVFCKNEVLESVNQFRLVDTKKSKDVGKDSAEHETIHEVPENERS